MSRTATHQRPRVIVVGDLVTDVLAVPEQPLAPGSDTPATIRISGGGSAANTAAWLVRAGVASTLVAVVGTDLSGTQRRDELAELGVGCAIRRTAQAPTGAVVVLSAAGERSMLVQRGANRMLTAADIDAALVEPADHLHLSGYTLFDPMTRAAAQYALHEATRRAMTASVDMASAAPIAQVGPANLLGWVEGVNLLLANAEEAAALLADGRRPADRPPNFDPLPPERAAIELTRWCRWAVVKRGPDGAVGATPDGSVQSIPALKADVVDVTGAGDAFAAGLIAARLAGGDHASALAAGTRLAAQAVAQLGARPAGPGASQGSAGSRG